MPSAIVPESWRVTATRRETDDTWTLDLEPAGGGATNGLPFEPGQFTMLYSFGAGEVPISISGDPAEPGRLVHTVRAVGAVTKAVCSVAEGDVLGVRGPFGRGWPVGAAEGGDLLIVAGGVGLAPLRPAILSALGNRDRFGRVVVLYGGRLPDQLLFRHELDEWEEREDVELLVTVDAADTSWRGNVGVVPALIGRARPDPERTVAMVCGPEIMMRFSADALLGAGIPPERIHLSMERNMKCAVGHCGHCQWGQSFVCRHGPVFSHSEIAARMRIEEL